MRIGRRGEPLRGIVGGKSLSRSRTCRAAGEAWSCTRQASADHALCEGHRTAQKRHPGRELRPLRVYRRRNADNPIPPDEAYALHQAGFITTAPRQVERSDDGFITLLDFG